MKGYPKTRFDIVDQSMIQEIAVTNDSGIKLLAMQTYTSDKGTEDWEVISTFNDFTKIKGPLSFLRHGQAQLTVAEILRNGGAVLGKRMVSEDATLANLTVRARIIVVDNVSYVYFYTVSAMNSKSFRDARDEGYANFDETNYVQADGSVDLPLFTITPKGRGISKLYFRVNPEYNTARSSSNYIRYSFEIYEDAELLESIVFTMNSNIIENGVSQALNPKVKARSQQIQCHLYEDGLGVLIKELAKTALDDSGNLLGVNTLINYDFLYGYNLRGTQQIGGIIVSADASASGTDLWTTNIPADISSSLVDLSDSEGIRIPGGSYGTAGTSPINNKTEYEKMLLACWGADQDSMLFDPVIYDLDSYKIDATFDCGFPLSVKKAITNVFDFRGDAMFFCDFGTNLTSIDDIIAYADNIPKTRNVAMYHNFFNVYDPYTRKEITVTMPYLLAIRMVNHLKSGVSRPFAGIANNLTFPEIIDRTVNFLPYEIPGINQKQMIVDHNINYISYYDGIPTMESLYTNQDYYSQLSFLNNVMGVQEIIKAIRTRCPRIRYTFLDGEDLDKYIEDVKEVVSQYNAFYKTLDVQYMADEQYEKNKIFYAMLTVQFRDFIQEEYFKIVAIS